MTIHHLTHNKIRLALHEVRPGSGRPLLLLHGLGEQSPASVPDVARLVAATSPSAWGKLITPQIMDNPELLDTYYDVMEANLAAQLANNPTPAQVTALSTQLKTSADALAAAITQNTPAA